MNIFASSTIKGSRILKLLILLSVTWLVCKPNAATAHILVMDSTEQVGAVVHITPDDDPIAGEPASIYMDIQGAAISDQSHEYSFTVTDVSGAEVSLPIAAAGSTVSIGYAFPQQGHYRLTLTATPKIGTTTQSYTFSFGQRVTRGVAYGVIRKPQHPLAEGILIAVGCAFVLVCAAFYYRRKEILQYSQWKQNAVKATKERS
jgi:hypothetical protein